MLTAQGYIIRKALNGPMAIASCKTLLPSLILLDIMMPEMNGYEVCRYLKADEKTSEVPVIFISALDDVWDKVKAFNVGGVDYITKPFQREEVLTRLTNQLTIRQMRSQLIEKNLQLQKLNEELARSNAELEQFAYAASHDLQSPLQAIVGYAGILSLKYKHSLDTEAERYLRRISEAGMRMNQLIQDLLAFSSVGKLNQEFELTDCKTILEEVLANLREEIFLSGAAITYGDLPTVMADKMQLMRLFQNLLSNAIKFRRPEVPPNIKISTKLHNDCEWVIGINDNGIGIAPQHFDRIFEMFQRLQTYKDYPGTGIGMAVCKKIVEYHGGRIWVESQVGEGTTFYFTIPSTMD
jgi:light-regulated signal transduction histidine kinase (bacteriophytochrome)